MFIIKNVTFNHVSTDNFITVFFNFAGNKESEATWLESSHWITPSSLSGMSAKKTLTKLIRWLWLLSHLEAACLMYSKNVGKIKTFV